MTLQQKYLFTVLGLFFIFIFTSYAQKTLKIEDYIGLWKGKAQYEELFKINVAISQLDDETGRLKLLHKKELFNQKFKWQDTINIQLNDKLLFEGIVTSDSEIQGFVKFGLYFYPIILKKEGAFYNGSWNLVTNHFHLQPKSLYLSIKAVNESDDGFKAYPLLGSYWVKDLKLEGDAITFEDYKTGLVFNGKLITSKFEFKVSSGSLDFGTIIFNKVEQKNTAQENQQHRPISDGWEYASNPLTLSSLERDINKNALKGIESVLVAQNGNIQYENYFNGTNAMTTNDLRSAGKSIGSAIIGIAIDEGVITNIHEKIYDYMPSSYQYTIDDQKSTITIEDLLTMSSGIGVFENDYQESDDWLKKVLEPKLKYAAGTRTNYMSADPFLLSVNLSERLSYPLEFYIQKKLFAPLGITNYMLNTDDKGNPYFAGGLYMTPRDMLKFGQLYLNKGTWGGKRIISEQWVKNSFKKHTKLENTSKKNTYGYLWWHETYTINQKPIAAIEARGNGGQYISIIPELNLVIVVTTENYNKKGAAKQTEKIIKEYVLSALMKA
ncbi:serine hydrolase [Aquimarina sp. U1-2]|uniref:serine hydrolase domain-containing protein n=1 Tax=Aquimarina sp. U1-2 TaxID=2823141 RepID=UPI001AECE9AE|nr:serine hydrolase [Aquimarina sp. U1-2]MBP2831646.1 serine hydrolase [Aquimarina sp. U1-2]